VLSPFREIVAVDTEFTAIPGNRPEPVCLVARELRSGRRFRLFEGQFGSAPPYATGPDVLLTAYYASAELGCYRVLGWPMPERTLDLFTEFRDRTNGLPTPAGAGLLGALTYFGLDGMGATEKKELQEAIGNGTWRGRYKPEEILDYCATDVMALERLLPAMLPRIDLPRALLRGRYMAAAAAMEHNGTPIDVEMLELLRQSWEGMQDRLIADGCRVPMIFVTAYFEERIEAQAMEAGAYGFLRKPFDDESFVACLDKALTHGQAGR